MGLSVVPSTKKMKHLTLATLIGAANMKSLALWGVGRTDE
jgi:hypothetical protein